MHISAQHLAELLMGIARAQAAIVQGIENEMGGRGEDLDFSAPPP